MSKILPNQFQSSSLPTTVSSDYLNFLPEIRGQYRKQVKLKNWFDVGGPAEILFRPADLKDLQFFLRKIPKNLPLQVIGAGSNVIIDDAGISGAVIRFGSEFAEISHKISANGEIEVSAKSAVLCANLATYCQIQDIGAFEFLSTIPGAIGGALAMNAGCYGSEISDIVQKIIAVDFSGNLVNLGKSECGFAYRVNKMAKELIFVEGIFIGTFKAKEEISEKISEFKKNRENSQPVRAKTGGSTFKNPSESEIIQLKAIHPEVNFLRAWEFIDAIGFRGKKIGDAIFSEKHCNFLINLGEAKAKDLLQLIECAQNEIQQKFGLRLLPEIKHLR